MGMGNVRWPSRKWQTAPASPFGLTTEMNRSLELQKTIEDTQYDSLQPPQPNIRKCAPSIHSRLTMRC